MVGEYFSGQMMQEFWDRDQRWEHKDGGIITINESNEITMTNVSLSSLRRFVPEWLCVYVSQDFNYTFLEEVREFDLV